MADAFLIPLIAAVFVFGYFAANRLTRVIEEAGRDSSAPPAEEETPRILLTGETPPAEIRREVDRVCGNRDGKAAIVIVSEGTALYERLVGRAGASGRAD